MRADLDRNLDFEKSALTLKMHAKPIAAGMDAKTVSATNFIDPDPLMHLATAVGEANYVVCMFFPISKDPNRKVFYITKQE